MSNLKKVLAMVLAVAMLLSMGLTAGAGAFSDVKATDDYSRAINLLASLEVLKGFEDGTYNAAGTYTREQFAKILYVLMNGKDDGAAMYSGTSPFADVAADRWSAGYITWAKNAKVINGREDGLFWPTDIVTYAEAAKMFVVAMGYDSTVYTFPYGFIDKAQTLKLFDDVKGMTANGPANRGTVAQMAFNALFAAAPRFGTYAAQVGTSSTTSTETYTVAEGAFGMRETMAVLLATSTYALGYDFTDESQVALDEWDSDWYYDLTGLYAYDGSVDEYVGAKVAVWYKPAKTSDDKDKIFDIQPASSCKIIEFTSGDVKSGTDADDLVVKLGGVEKTYDYSGNGVSSTGATVALTEALFEGTTNTSAKFKAIDYDGDSDLDDVIVTFADTAKVSALTSTRVSFTSVKAGEVLESGTKDIKEDDVVIYKMASGIAKSDYVIATAHNEFTEEGMQTIFDVIKATEIDGAKLTKISGGDFYFDGTVYTAAGEANLSGDDDFEEVGKVGNKYDLVLNANGDIVFCSKVSSVVSKDKWILAMDLGISTKLVGGLPVYELKTITGYLADGTKKTFTVDSDLVVDGTEIDTEDETVYGAIADDIIYQYDVNSDGEIDTLKTAAYVADEKDYGFDATGLATYSTSTTIMKVDPLTGYVDDDSIIFFKTSAGKYSVIAPSELKKMVDNVDDTLDITGNMFVVDDDSAAVIVLLTGATKPIKVDESFGYILWAEKEVSGDDYVYTFSVAYDGKVETVKTDAVEDDYEGFDSYVNLDDTIGFMKLVFDTNGFLDDLVAIDAADLVSVSPTKVLDGALMGNVIENGDIVTDDAVDSIDYAVADAATLAALTNNSFADEVYYYLVSDFPVNASGAAIGCLDYDVDVAVSDKDSINTSGSTLTYVVTVIYNSDDEIESVFIYSDPVRSDEIVVLP